MSATGVGIVPGAEQDDQIARTHHAVVIQVAQWRKDRRENDRHVLVGVAVQVRQTVTENRAIRADLFPVIEVDPGACAAALASSIWKMRARCCFHYLEEQRPSQAVSGLALPLPCDLHADSCNSVQRDTRSLAVSLTRTSSPRKWRNRTRHRQLSGSSSPSWSGSQASITLRTSTTRFSSSISRRTMADNSRM